MLRKAAILCNRKIEADESAACHDVAICTMPDVAQMPAHLQTLRQQTLPLFCTQAGSRLADEVQAAENGAAELQARLDASRRDAEKNREAVRTI